jgi:7-keto-8-aminopelargonate synthetase-like enzyme
MNEFDDIVQQMAGRSFHRIVPVDSLPGPTFSCDGRQIVSFSSNNYLALASSRRLIEVGRAALWKSTVGWRTSSPG